MCTRIWAGHRSVRSLLLTFEHAAPTAEMDGNKFWSDQTVGRPYAWPSDALANVHILQKNVHMLSCNVFSVYLVSYSRVISPCSGSDSILQYLP